MITRQSYWDAYCLYIDRCVKENWENDIDPHHYEMEWNHFLPVSIFGDQPLGQYITRRQHAIASALQTLAFGRSCMCAWHKKHLPETLLGEAWPIYREMGREMGVKWGRKGAEVVHAVKDSRGRSKHAVKMGKKGAKATLDKLHSPKDSNGRSLHAVMMSHAAKLKVQKRTELTRIEDGVVFTFDCAREAAKAFGLDYRNLSAACLGKIKSTKGFTARYL